MSNFLCKSETLSLIAEKLAERAAKTNRPHAGDTAYFFKKILKMNQISSGDMSPREYVQQCGKRYIRTVHIVAACRCFTYQVAGIFEVAGGHKVNFNDNKTMQEIQTIGYNAAVAALQNAAAHDFAKADSEFWG